MYFDLRIKNFLIPIVTNLSLASIPDAQLIVQYVIYNNIYIYIYLYNEFKFFLQVYETLQLMLYYHIYLLTDSSLLFN